jgi:hypothetical protein
MRKILVGLAIALASGMAAWQGSPIDSQAFSCRNGTWE